MLTATNALLSKIISEIRSRQGDGGEEGCSRLGRLWEKEGQEISVRAVCISGGSMCPLLYKGFFKKAEGKGEKQQVTN